MLSPAMDPVFINRRAHTVLSKIAPSPILWQDVDLSLLPIRASTVNDGAGAKKVEREHEIGEMQQRVSDEKAKTALESKNPVVIGDAATIIIRTLSVTLFHEVSNIVL
ncbi:hypothetical protein F442_02761 [Phytophthora nicotianae P10297]|uniref:Uncharacterized protein n=4 Tax=Phytophthora nicotianae TaxID=4792 RepID=W2QMJ1_PHYN3|nr:hypothetical protein PPTG_22115 [Phytophthora nicotianae INRA-310]ETN14407.1 hypothetical protein PPTG_22115 [Phytophthora nicotianae INRA-310]ETP52189.1 hypothetical protein F442_02761 [Phytophthora nicotianae P10297]